MASSKQLSTKYEADCQYLHHFFSGNSGSSNARRVVEIFTQRNVEELKLIRGTYYGLYNHDLLHLLSRMKTTLARVAYLRACEPSNRDAELIRNSLFGKNLDLDVLIEIVCTRSSSELISIKLAYHARYYSDLERDVSSKTNGNIKEILLAVMNSSKYSGGKVDKSMAMCDSKTLYEAIESGKYIDQRCITLLLKQRSSDQMKAILFSYKQLYGQEFSKFLKKDKCGEFGRQLRVAIRCIQFPEKHFAKQLRKTLKNSDACEVIIRTIVTRSAVDIKQINEAFTKKTGWTLETLIRNEFNNSSSQNDKVLYDLVGDILVALVKHSRRVH
ncbi:annexin D6-like [Typha latifolia]|uniref:annexin D6-like n=1 Tax=Typha latifolia TaxID=4733 RepID=UPI003C2E8B6C